MDSRAGHLPAEDAREGSTCGCWHRNSKPESSSERARSRAGASRRGRRADSGRADDPRGRRAGRDGNSARRLLGDDVASAIEGILAPEGEFVDKRARRWFGATAGMWCSRSVLRRSAMPMGGRRAVYLFHDVSQREQQERAEREFVTNAAHQLQSPLTGILSAIEVLQAGAKDGPQRGSSSGTSTGSRSGWRVSRKRC